MPARTSKSVDNVELDSSGPLYKGDPWGFLPPRNTAESVLLLALYLVVVCTSLMITRWAVGWQCGWLIATGSNLFAAGLPYYIPYVTGGVWNGLLDTLVAACVMVWICKTAYMYSYDLAYCMALLVAGVQVMLAYTLVYGFLANARPGHSPRIWERWVDRLDKYIERKRLQKAKRLKLAAKDNEAKEKRLAKADAKRRKKPKH